MFAHFAFGKLKDNLTVQVEKFIECILIPKRLKYSHNTEFLIAENSPGNEVNPDCFKFSNGILSCEANEDNFIYSDSKCRFLPHPVYMICLINSSFNKIKNSGHLKMYGRCGIFFSRNFVNKNKFKQVMYYKIENVFNNPEIAEWNKLERNQNKSSKEINKIRDLVTKITHFKKPEKMYKEFQQKIIQVKNNSMNIIPTYDGYLENYDFRNENEFRTVGFSEDQYLNFKEKDVVSIFVPNEESKNKLIHKLQKNWSLFDPKIIKILD